MFVKKSNQEFIQECKNMGYDLPVDKYQGSYVKIRFMCNNGHEYLQTPKNHMQGYGCSLCKGKKKKTNEQYIQECKDKNLDMPIEEYRGTRIKIKHRCKQGHIYSQAPCDHLHNHGCPYCSKNHKLTNKEYIDKCIKLRYDLPIESYVNSMTRIKHKCTKCGAIYYQTSFNHLRGSGCYFCMGGK